MMDQVEMVSDEVTDREREGRLDLRSLQTVTIDGEDAKDLMMRFPYRRRTVCIHWASTLRMSATM